jgi:HSP20 family protein
MTSNNIIDTIQNNLMRNFFSSPAIADFFKENYAGLHASDRIEARKISPLNKGEKILFHTPVTEVQELSSHYLAWIEMPGVKIQDVEIKLRKNDLIISGSQRRSNTQFEDVDGASKMKQVKTSFRCTLGFDDPIDAAKIEASFDDGVLQLALPKKHPVEEKLIPVKAGTGSEFRRIYESKAILNEHMAKSKKKKFRQ